MAPRNVSYSQQITKFLECTFKSHQDLMFHRVVRESRYRFVVGLFDHCEPFHRHLQQLLDLNHPQNSQVVIARHYVEEIILRQSNEQPNRSISPCCQGNTKRIGSSFRKHGAEAREDTFWREPR